MKIWRYAKNAMLSSTITTIYAIWSREQLHQESTIKMWMILIAVAFVIYGIICSVDKELIRIQKERRRKRDEKNTKHSKRVESTER